MSILTDPNTGETFLYNTRAEWGARVPKARAGLSSTVNGVFMHHTVTAIAPADAIVRAVQNFHMDSRGWNDIAYSFLIDVVTGTIYEGRGIGIAGGHTRGYNSSSHAICWIANTDEVNPSMKAKRAWLAVLHTIEQQYGRGPRRGHQDVASTGCPGGFGYSWLKAGFPVNDGTTPAPAPEPQPAPAPPGERVLRNGMSGDDVKQWQTRLQGRGYWIAADSVFGDLTEGITRWFQEGRGFTGDDVDGVVGPMTRGEMSKAEREGWKPSLGGEPAPPPPPSGPPWPGRKIREGDWGNDVREWQTQMKNRGWRISVDGDYGSQSKSVCEAFQGEKGLDVNGVVGADTWTAAWNAPVT